MQLIMCKYVFCCKCDSEEKVNRSVEDQHRGGQLGEELFLLIEKRDTSKMALVPGISTNFHRSSCIVDGISVPQGPMPIIPK